MYSRNKIVPHKLSIEPPYAKPCTFKDIIPHPTFPNNIKIEKPSFKPIKLEDNQYFDYISYGGPSPEKILNKKRQRKNSDESGKKASRRFDHISTQRVNELCLNSKRRHFDSVSVCRNVENIFLKPIRNKVNCERVNILTNFSSEDFLSQGRWSIPVSPEKDKNHDNNILLPTTTEEKKEIKPSYVISSQETTTEKKKRGRPKKQDTGVNKSQDKSPKTRGKSNIKEPVITSHIPFKQIEKKKEIVFQITKDYSRKKNSNVADVRKPEGLIMNGDLVANHKKSKQITYSMQSTNMILKNNKEKRQSNERVSKNFSEIFPSDCMTTPTTNKVIKKSFFSPERACEIKNRSKDKSNKKVNTIIIEKVESPKMGKSKIREIPNYPNVLSCDFSSKKSQSSSRKKY